MQKRALIVDGEPGMCKLLQEVLLSTGIETVTLTKTAEAAGHLQKGKFDIVVMDLSLQPSEGVELTRTIRGTGFNRMTPIVMIGDSQRNDTLTRGFQAGGSFLIYKPVDRMRLAKLIRVAQGAIEHERRRFQRVPMKTRIRLKTGPTEIEGETIDLSMNGAFVKASRVFPMGTIVEVTLFLAGSPKPVLGRGSVMRVVGLDHMGIYLDCLPLAESQRLQEFMIPHVEA